LFHLATSAIEVIVSFDIERGDGRSRRIGGVGSMMIGRSFFESGTITDYLPGRRENSSFEEWSEDRSPAEPAIVDSGEN